jgi:mono/diheme cytochrome c family protein
MSQDPNETTLQPGPSAPSIPNAHVIEERFRESELSGDIDLRKMHGAILREMSEPSDGSEPIPMWMLAGITALALFCGGYLAFYSGGFRGDIFNFTPDFSLHANVATGPPDPKVLGKKVFTANCVACHQTTGLGQPGQFPPLVASEWVVGDAPNRMVAIVLHGIQGPIKVNGVAYNGAMPAWETLGDEKVAAVLTYVRSEWGNSAPPISKDAVAAIREKTKGQLGNPWTEAQLLAMPPDVSILQLGAVAGAPAAAPGAPPAAPGTPPAAPGAPAAAPGTPPAAPAPK